MEKEAFLCNIYTTVKYISRKIVQIMKPGQRKRHYTATLEQKGLRAMLKGPGWLAELGLEPPAF